MVDTEQLQQMARMVDLNRQRLEQINDQISRLELVINEHEDVEVTLNSLNEGEQSIIPIGAGVQVPFQPLENQTVVADIGSGFHAEMTPSRCTEIIESRKEDLIKVIKELEKEATIITQRIESTAEEFEKATSDLREADIQAANSEKPPETSPKQKRRTGFGGELTLDD